MSMSQMEMKQRLEKLQSRSFMIQMNDHMSMEDYDTLKMVDDEIKALRKQLEERKDEQS